MTTPTPGQPLSEADVSMLQPGDWLLVSCPDGFLRNRGFVEGRPVRLRSAEDGWIDLADMPYAQGSSPARFTFLGRPDQDGWMQANGIRPRGLPDDLKIDWRREGVVQGPARAGNFNWDLWCDWRPHAPVSRPGDGVDFTSVDGLWKDQRLSRLERVKSHRIQFGSSLKQAVEAVDEESSRQSLAALTPPAEPVSRPAGEGEREAVARVQAQLDSLARPFDNVVACEAADLRLILSLLSPAAPDAGGGERRVLELIADGWEVIESSGSMGEMTLKAPVDWDEPGETEVVFSFRALQPGGER